MKQKTPTVTKMHPGRLVTTALHEALLLPRGMEESGSGEPTWGHEPQQ